ncbi:MAG TPA: 2-amino-4-hydroxy-6-hydroxymethyldihydropteridine diphosphokinase [Chloroflexi bacterium]|jgi:2-amino-4-hydroxy-6-hydroxymethyldihydropteridine diphosphokinase|nr:2-amino-4-hydroxy-6-hydroxymethyldihydropteridine diphosphokinase [Chloroflexota bacterium]
MATVYIGLGANLGDREANIREALRRMADARMRILAVSPLYETEPWGITDQPRFLNGACAIETDLSPEELLDTLKKIEADMGRVRTVRNGPRPIDLDILLYDDRRIETPRLKVPHPGIVERNTVLVPLVDIAPDLKHPLTGRTMTDHLADLGPTPDVAPYPPGLPVDTQP